MLTSLPRASRVQHLLLLGGPTDVARFVVSVDVNAIKGMLRRRFQPHVSQECFERVTPLVAYLNAATAVVLKVTSARNIASAFHRVPRQVLGCSRSSVTKGRLAGAFSLIAAAGSRAALRFQQGAGFHVSLDAASATTFELTHGDDVMHAPTATAISDLFKDWRRWANDRPVADLRADVDGRSIASRHGCKFTALEGR